MKKVIKRMKRNRLLYLFSGKCPVPESRGGHSLDDSTGNDEPESDPNDSKLAFDFITHGLPVADVFVFNMRDICELAAGQWGFCKNCTREECMVIADCLNFLVRLAKSMGARISLFNIGGVSLAVHPHLSNLIRHRRISYPNGEQSQIETVRSSLVELLDAIGRPQNLQRMINDIRFEMVRNTSHLYNDEERELAKQRALECFRDGIVPTIQERNDNLLLDIELKLGRKHYEGLPKRVRKYISSGQRPTEKEMSEVWFRMVYDREWQKEEERLRREEEELHAKEAKQLAKEEERRRRREEEELRAKEAKQLVKEERRRRREEEELRAKEAKKLAKEERRRRQEEAKEERRRRREEEDLCVDVSDMPEQPLIERKDSEPASKYVGVNKDKDKWRARIKIKNRRYNLGRWDTEEEAAQVVAKANKKYIADRQAPTSHDTLDVSDMPEQPLIERKDSEPASKYVGVSKYSSGWSARICINGVLYIIGWDKSEEVAAQLFEKANKKYILEKKPLTRRPKIESQSENKKKTAPAKVRSLPSSDNEDLYEPTAKKQKIKETVVVAPIISSFVDLSNEDWEEVYETATKTTEMLAKEKYVFCFSPGSAIGVVIEDKDGRCVVVGKRDEQTPLEIDDIIVSVNGINLIGEHCVTIFSHFSRVVRTVVVIRSHKTNS